MAASKKRNLSNAEAKGKSTAQKKMRASPLDTQQVQQKRKPTDLGPAISLPHARSTSSSTPDTDAIVMDWTEKEDSVLRDAVLRNGDDWVVVREFLVEHSSEAGSSMRTAHECQLRWTEVVCSKHKKGPWTEDEDLLVRKLVKSHGPKKWSALAVSVPGRTGKQCRERWVNHLSPDVNKGDWTPEEEQTLLQQHDILGNQWCKIAQQLPGRSENAVKNRWNSYLNRSSTRGDGKSRPRKAYKTRTPNGSSDKLESLESLVSPKKVMRPVLTQSPKPSQSMTNYRSRLAKPLSIKVRSNFFEDEYDAKDVEICALTDFDSVMPTMVSPAMSPGKSLSPAALSPMSPQCSFGSLKLSPLWKFWSKSPVFAHNS